MNFILFVCCICIGLAVKAEPPIVKTPKGLIAGSFEQSYSGRTFVSFTGIPFAKPPVGNLRFEEPQPVDPWKGVWQANISSYCIQIMHGPEPEGGHLEGEEDCLYLNVIVPRKEINQNDKLDVIVHIHGGAFMFGSGLLYAGPKFIMDREVILVTLNYRLGPFGFLSTQDSTVPGNNGMKDQVMALKWVQDNIEYFGGNRDSVTITGLSAGGASVHYHYLSPLSKGLFHKGISLSGTALCPWTFQEEPLQKAKQLSSSVGCPTNNNKDMISCLKTRPARQIAEEIRPFRPWLMNPFSPFGIVVEKESTNPFLAEHPYIVLQKGNAHDLPWITSVTSDEGLYPAGDFIVKESYLPYLEAHWEELAPFVLDYNYTIPKNMHKSISDKVKAYYLNNEDISRKTYSQLIQLMGDRLFVVDAEIAARIQSKNNKSPVYFYYYSFTGEERDSIQVLITGSKSKYGVSHGDDVMFIFTVDEPIPKLTKTDEEMKNIFLDMWESFAKIGKPVMQNVEWSTVSKTSNSDFKYLHIKSPNKIYMEEAKELGHRSFWQSLPFLENDKLFADLVHDEF